MTAVVEEVELGVDLDAFVPCRDGLETGIEHPAIWRGQMRCCNDTALLCQEHREVREWAIALWSQRWDLRCGKCDAPWPGVVWTRL